MGEAEFVNILQDDYKDSINGEKPVFSINENDDNNNLFQEDFKRESKAFKKGNSRKSNLGYGNYSYDYKDENTPQKSLFENGLSEQIISIIAIFIFFGVSIFFVGLWAGKNTVKSIMEKDKKYIAELEQELMKRKVENNPINTPIVEPKAKTEAEIITPLPKEEVSVKNVVAKDNTQLKVVKAKETKQTSVAKVEEKKKDSSTDIKKKTETKQSKDYTIQISAHTSMDKARAIENEIRKLGYQAYLVEAVVNGVTYYRVRAGQFTKEEADNALKKIKSLSIGKDSFVLKL